MNMTSEVRFDTRETFALEMLAALDMTDVSEVVQDGLEIVVFFNLSLEDLALRLEACEAALDAAANSVDL